MGSRTPSGKTICSALWGLGRGGDALWFIILDKKYSCYPYLKF